jgi:branched-chain amino acid transport system substrate-binding protein
VTGRVAGAAAIGGLVLALAGCHRPADPIRFGALLPLTGLEANYGEYARNAISLAVTEINASGGIRRQPLLVVYEDGQTSAASASSAYLKLIGHDHVIATLAEGSPAVITAAPIANSEKSVLLNCGAATMTLREAGPLVFSAIADGGQEAEAMATFVVERLHLKDVATLGLESEFNSTAFKEPDLEQMAAFSAALSKLGGRDVADIRLPREKDDFQPQIAALKVRQPAAVYYVGPLREALIVFRQARAMGVRTQWLSGATLEKNDVLAVPEAEGAIYTYPRAALDEQPRGQQFAEKYRARFGVEPDVHAATCYDGVYALKAAIERAGGTAAGDIARGLRQAPYAGVAGPLDFTKALWVKKPLEFRTVKGDRFETLGQ